MTHIFLIILFCIAVAILFRMNFDAYKSKSFDAIYIITLERTRERAYPLEQQLRDFGYDPLLFYGVDGKEAVRNDPQLKTRFQGIKRDGEIGCWLSHYKLLEKIASLPYDANILVLEDDAVVNSPFKVPNCNFDFMYLGYIGEYDDWVSQMTAPLWKTFIRSQGHAGTHAYCVTTQGARKIIQKVDSKARSLPIDLAYMHIFETNPDIRVFSVIPIQSHQMGKDSVIHDTYSP